MTDSRPADDALEILEWLEALDGVVAREGPDRARELLEKVADHAREAGVPLATSLETPYVNTIPVAAEDQLPGDRELERRLIALVRWNAMATVLQANRESTELGGHIASYQSASTLYEVGFNHFWRAPSTAHGGDLVFMQGHSSPGIYARAFLEGRLDLEQMRRFRREVGGGGLSSYPHPWLMPDFWQFPTVSMGLGPIMAIYQAFFMKYLTARGVRDTTGRKVWAFMGDGEMDEPESMGAISLAGREHLDNLVFVVNCNLQRLDGPVRGNGKIIQELETNFRGAGWNVIKVIWGSNWDPLLAADRGGHLKRLMAETIDGEYQTYKSKDGAFVREHFFGKHPETAAMVADWTDDQIWQLNRGGHDPQKVYAAYAAAARCTVQPTVILAKTVKGHGMGEAGEGKNITHQQKKMTESALLSFRDRFGLTLTDDEVRGAEFHLPPADSPELVYMRERRAALGGSLPARARTAEPLVVPDLGAFAKQLEGTEREISSTMAFVQVLNTLLRDETIGARVVPITPDESRTFGMEGMFRQYGIFSQVGQLYQPEDAGQLLFYREDKSGQILQEGINEAGAMASWIAAATSYSTHGVITIPFYIFYSIFGFQRIGDLAWAAGDSRARGFLVGATSGRTTLNGEGLQHQDGHSHLAAATIPNCRAYDPTFSYEIAVIVQDGLRRMCVDQEDTFTYLTVANENYGHPSMPEGARDGILRGMHRIGRTGDAARHRVQLLGSGAILQEVVHAADILAAEHEIGADVWSITSFTELRRDGMAVDRWNLLHPLDEPRFSNVELSLAGTSGPVIASTDYMRSFADQIRPWVRSRYTALGTDGFGRSDTRASLRRFFEVDRNHIVVAALKALADDGVLAAGGRPCRDADVRDRTRNGGTVDTVTPVLVPDIGDATDVAVIEIHVAPGDTIKAEDPIVTLESDKATMDVPSPVEGVVTSVAVAVGDVVAEGLPLIEVRTADDIASTAGSVPVPAVAEVTAPGAAAEQEEDSVADEAGIHASPLARRLARELGVDLTGVHGTAPNGRISRDDVLAAASPTAAAPPAVVPPAIEATAPVLQGLAPWPSVDFAKFGEIEVVPLTRINRLVGANLHRNWVQIPHVTHHDEADVTDLEAFRVRTNEEQAKSGLKVTMVALLLKACAATLREQPRFNASLDGDNLVLKHYYHLGVAVDTDNGLVVPVVRDVDRKGLLELAAELAEVSGRARGGKLTPGDMQGATFTISSLGGIGGTGFTPIVNAPEVAILGVTRTATKPVWDGTQFAPRLMLPLSLSYDHRVIDGAAAARFTRSLARVLEDLRRTLL